MSQLAHSYWLSYIVNNVVLFVGLYTVGVICNDYTCLQMIYEMKSMRLKVSLMDAEPSESVNNTADKSL